MYPCMAAHIVAGCLLSMAGRHSRSECNPGVPPHDFSMVPDIVPSKPPEQTEVITLYIIQNFEDE